MNRNDKHIKKKKINSNIYSSFNRSIAYIFKNQEKLALTDEGLAPCMNRNKNTSRPCFEVKKWQLISTTL